MPDSTFGVRRVCLSAPADTGHGSDPRPCHSGRRTPARQHRRRRSPGRRRWAGLALRRACTAAGVAPLRVYDLRHSFGTAVLQVTDQRTAQAALRHASIQTTHRYTLAAVPEQVRVALRLIGGRDTAAKTGMIPAIGLILCA